MECPITTGDFRPRSFIIAMIASSALRSQRPSAGETPSGRAGGSLPPKPGSVTANMR